MSNLSPVFEMRQLTVDDAVDAAGLADAIGWVGNVDRFRQIIVWGGDGNFCLTYEGRLVATSTTIRYGRERGWIGMVLVHPDCQKRGLGTRITKAALDYLHAHDVREVMLAATEQGFPIYKKLDFQPLYQMESWRGEAPSLPGDAARHMTEADLPGVIALDAELFGVARPQVLTWFFRMYPHLAWVDGEPDALTGYVMANTGLDNAALIGPWMHRTPEGAERLVKTALNVLAGQPVRINIPEHNQAARQFAAAAGLECRLKTTRMIHSRESSATDGIQEYGGSMPAIG
jgi:GNAT superfamily N-acetyltransferase